MKLRIQGNSLRLRIKKTELDIFSSKKEISDSISFGADSEIKYTLKQTDSSEVSSLFKENEIIVFVPVDVARKWIDTDLISIINSNSIPSLLIEKDFKCTSSSCSETEEEIKNSFQNPNEKC